MRGYHEWHVRGKSLYDFVPLLFRKAGQKRMTFRGKEQPESQDETTATDHGRTDTDV